jgi:hypothetical protein
VWLAVIYGFLLVMLKKIKSAVVKRQHLYRLTVYRDGVGLRLTALADTGNELRGSNGESVIIAERSAVKRLYENAEDRLRLLPFKSVGKADGVLIGVLCDYAVLDGVTREAVIVAAVDARLGNGVYNALINPELEVR